MKITQSSGYKKKHKLNVNFIILLYGRGAKVNLMIVDCCLCSKCYVRE